MYKFTTLWLLCFASIFMVTSAQKIGQRTCDNLRNRTHSFTCKRVNACQYAKDVIRTGSVVPCGFENHIQQICCPERLPTKITPITTITPVTQVTPNKITVTPVTQTRDVYKIARTKCLEYGNARYINKTIPGLYVGAPNRIQRILDCIKAETLIVGGNNSMAKEFPHMALIGYKDRLEDVSWDCGGSLISERFVLSAAHCSVGELGEARWVRLGELALDSDVEGKHYVDYAIIQRYDHPGYKAPQIYNDIALFRLSSEVKFNPYIRPICLYTSVVLPPAVQNKAVITGWGYVGAGEQRSDSLLKATIKFLDDKECIPVYENDRTHFGRGYDPESMICAGDKINGKDTCGGDSGGPIQIPVSNFQCMWTQIGITSIGSTFCGDKKPAVYTEVYYYIPWIVSIVWP